MRIAVFFAVGFLLCSLPAGTQERAAPVPPGLHHAEKEGSRPLEPPVRQHRRADPAQLKQEAEELAKLSAAVPSGIDLVSRGQLPKNLTDQLKRIEKLAKQLRSEISH
jgi:hypothetical protein